MRHDVRQHNSDTLKLSCDVEDKNKISNSSQLAIEFIAIADKINCKELSEDVLMDTYANRNVRIMKKISFWTR